LSSAVEGYTVLMLQDPRRSAPALLVPLLAGCLLAGCVGPTVTAKGYRDKVTETARTVVSAVVSATYAAQLDLRGRLTFAVADTVVSEAEQDARSARGALDSRQPPDEQAMQLGERARRPIEDAVDGLRQLRIAMRRGDRAGIQQALSGLAGPARELEALAGP
jgi:hypothetical protein